ncbi:MAG: amidohydrolase [Clostridia bacterium]|nr:amidohydrolase [Clostridia bacterium]
MELTKVVGLPSEILQESKNIKSQLVNWRRDFHRYPELAFQEKRTSAKIAGILKSFGIDVKTGIAKTGVIGTLTGGKPGPTIALRADMDALPITEMGENDYRSLHQGVMHACGHDAHMAAVLGAAKILCQRKEQLKGKVKFIFQPAEEIATGGAQDMIKAGCLDGVDAIFGLHVWSHIPEGVVRIVDGPMMAAADKFRIEIIGKGSHASLPHQGIDPIVVASHLVINLQSIVSRELDPLESGVISVCKFHGGETFNIIPEKVTLEGSVRSFTEKGADFFHQEIVERTRLTCEMFGAKYHINYHKVVPPLINDKRMAGIFKSAAEKVVGTKKVENGPAMMSSEDFAYYLKEVPGAFCFIGAGKREGGDCYPHHHPHFDIDENALVTATAVMALTAFFYFLKPFKS